MKNNELSGNLGEKPQGDYLDLLSKSPQQKVPWLHEAVGVRTRLRVRVKRKRRKRNGERRD